MPWLYKRKDSAIYWIGYRHPITKELVRRSTGISDPKEARKQLERLKLIRQSSKAGLLTEEYYRAVSGQQLATLPLKPEMASWLSAVSGTTSKGTLRRYTETADQFCDFLKATDQRPVMSEITPTTIREFMNHQRENRAVASVNLARAILSVFFNYCLMDRKIIENPVKSTKPFKRVRSETVERRPFTAAELARVYGAVFENEFWLYMFTGGLYTGLRLGDLITIARKSVNLDLHLIELQPIKTGEKTVHIPIAPPLQDVLAKRMEECGAPLLWPQEAFKYERRGSAPFSLEFRNVLVRSGICGERKYGKPTHSRRKVSELSFHSLRHNFVSLLKISGAPQSVVKALAGHSSDFVSDLYTHIPFEVMQKAIMAMPPIGQ